MRRNRRIAVLSGVVVVGAIAGAILLSAKGQDRPVYRLDKVTRGDIVSSITATGTLSADTTVEVGSQVSGRISRLYADFNTAIKRGQLLAQIDPTFYKAAVDQARANVHKAQAEVDDAQRTYNREKDLFSKNLVAQADIDAATATLESAQAGLEQARAALHQAQVSLDNTTITAPISGVVISRNVDVGQTVAASFQVPALFTIANDLRKMQVQASVDEADIGNVKVGQDVTFRVDAYPDDLFRGTVREIRLAPVVSQNVVTYTVVIEVKNRDMKLLPGMTATVSILVAKEAGALRVPIAATQFVPPGALLTSSHQDKVPPGGKETQGLGSRGAAGREMLAVWVLNNGNPVRVQFRPGIRDTWYVEVADGSLHEGQDVIIGEQAGGAEGPAGRNPFAPRMVFRRR